MGVMFQRLDVATPLCRGQNVLHTLAKYAHENAASIFHLILRSIHNFPLNIPDGEGNTGLCVCLCA